MADEIDNDSGERMDGLDRVEALLRQLESEDLQFVAPPAEVWSGIEAELDEATVRGAPDRGRRVWLVAAAAAIVAVLTLGAVAAVLTDDDDAAVVSMAALSHQQGFDPRGIDAAATARLVQRGDEYELELADAILPELEGDDLELWLIEPDANGNPVDVAPVAVISAGPEGTYQLPPGLDPDSHFIVDISIEPRDGDVAHSGQSILRGALEPE